LATTQAKRKQLLDRIEQLIEAQEFEELRQVLSQSRSSDVAEVVEVLDEIARQILFDLLGAREAGEVLEKIDEATRSEVLEELSSDELTDMVATLPPDEAADIVADLSDHQSEHVLDQIPKDNSDQIEKLMRYPEDTAGGIMTPELVKVNINGVVGDAVEAFRKADPEEDFYCVFVVDDDGHYKGTINVHALLRHPGSDPVSSAIDMEIPAVYVGSDQEEIANIFRKNDLIVVPVVDSHGVLLGRITADDVVDVMEEEAQEDVMVMAGTHPAELDTRRIARAATVRLPWLLICMTGELFYAMIFFSLFEPLHNPADWICIIMFVPAIAATGGNSGMQSSTVVVRGLATGDLAAFDVSQVFWREVRVASIVAVTCALIAATVATVWLYLFPSTSFTSGHGPIVGMSVGLAMFFAILFSTLLGTSLPYVFRRIGVDPAISSGPLVTTTNDAISYLTYFSLALVLLRLLG